MFASMKTKNRFIDPDIKRLLDASLDEELRAAVRAYLERRGMTPSGFGRRVVRDPGLVSKRLQPGRTVTLDTADCILRFIGLLEYRPLIRWELDAFMQVTGIKPWVLGYRSVGQTRLVTKLRGGASPRLATLQRCRVWMREQVDERERWAICTAVSVKWANGAGEHGQPGLLLQGLSSQGDQPMTGHCVLLNTAQAAVALGASPRTLERKRVVGGGPRYVKVGRLVRYLPSDLERWIKSRGRKTTSDDGDSDEEEEE